MNSSMRSEPASSADPQPEPGGGAAIAPVGAIFGASLGVVLAALLDVSAPLAFDGGVSPSWMARNWLIGALVGAVGGYVLGALIAWELADDAVPLMNLHGTDPASLPITLEALDSPEYSEPRNEARHH